MSRGSGSLQSDTLILEEVKAMVEAMATEMAKKMVEDKINKMDEEFSKLRQSLQESIGLEIDAAKIGGGEKEIKEDTATPTPPNNTEYNQTNFN